MKIEIAFTQEEYAAVLRAMEKAGFTDVAAYLRHAVLQAVYNELPVGDCRLCFPHARRSMSMPFVPHGRVLKSPRSEQSGGWGKGLSLLS
jgi:hypothetical protein